MLRASIYIRLFLSIYQILVYFYQFTSFTLSIAGQTDIGMGGIIGVLVAGVLGGLLIGVAARTFCKEHFSKTANSDNKVENMTKF